MAPNPAPAGSALDAAAEVERLRMLLEKQASCLMRVGTDGTLLALSDAALSLLGGRELSQLLQTNITERLTGEAAKVWSDFVGRVTHGGSASAECEMEDLAGGKRAIMLLGVSLADHPDGVASMLITVRDISAAKRLEASLQEQDDLRRSAQEALDGTTANMERLRKKLEELMMERQQLRAALETILGSRQQIASSVEQLSGALRAAMEAAATARQVLEKGGQK